MRTLNRFIFGLIVAVLALVAFSFLLPRHVTVARSIVIDAAPDRIFDEINDLRRLHSWSPLTAIDSDVSYNYSGPDHGVGSTVTWTSRHPDVGNGGERIVRSQAGEVMESFLIHDRIGEVRSRFRLEPSAHRTIVTWSASRDLGNNPARRYMGLIEDEQTARLLGKGLAALKRLVENQGGANRSQLPK